jgi:hypothetical protein
MEDDIEEKTITETTKTTGKRLKKNDGSTEPTPISTISDNTPEKSPQKNIAEVKS